MMHLRVVSINSSTLMNILKGPDGSLYADHGSELLLLQILSEKIPFTYSLMNREDNVFGSIDSNGTWSGMIGMLQGNVADIAISWISITAARQEVVDYCFPYLIDRNQIVTSAPKSFHNEIAFLNPFHNLVWILILVSLLFSSLFMSGLKRLSSHNNTDFKSFTRTFLVEMGNLMTLLLNQGSYKRYMNNSTRMFVCMYRLAAVVLGLSYSCTLLSFLVYPQKEVPLKSVQDLRNAVVKGQYKFGVLNNSSHHFNLMQHDEGVMKDLADHVRSHPENIVNRYDEAMHRITTERFSIQSFRLTTLLEASKYDLNDFHIIPDSVGFSIVGIAFRKHFPHMEKVNRIIHRVTESGIYYKKIEDMMFWAKLKGRHQSPKRVVRALSFEDVDAQLMVLIIGFVLSSCCLFAEILYKKYSAAV